MIFPTKSPIKYPSQLWKTKPSHDNYESFWFKSIPWVPYFNACLCLTRPSLFGMHYQISFGASPGLSRWRISLQEGRRRGYRSDLWVRKISWGRKWQSTPVFLPEKSHGQRSLAGYSPWGCKDVTVRSCMSNFFSKSARLGLSPPTYRWRNWDSGGEVTSPGWYSRWLNAQFGLLSLCTCHQIILPQNG